MSKRRTYTPEFKAAAVLAVLTGTKTAAEVCREHRIKPSLLTRWKQQFLAQADQIFRGDQERQQAEARIQELERMVGRLTLQLEMAKKASLMLGLTGEDSAR
jgi:transposase-like protein